MSKKVFQLRSKDAPETPFVVKNGQSYRVITLGYIDVSNPSGDSIQDPLDLERVVIKKKGELIDGTVVYLAKNNCECGVNIEVFDK